MIKWLMDSTGGMIIYVNRLANYLQINLFLIGTLEFFHWR